MDKQNVVYTYNGILCNLIKEISHSTIWVNLEYIMLNTISQSQKDRYYVILLI